MSAFTSSTNGPAWYTYLSPCLRPRTHYRPSRKQVPVLDPGSPKTTLFESQERNNSAASPFTHPPPTVDQADQVHAIMARLDSSYIQVPPHASVSGSARSRKAVGFVNHSRRTRRLPGENSLTSSPFRPSRSLLGSPTSLAARPPRGLTHMRSSSLSSATPLYYSTSVHRGWGSTEGPASLGVHVNPDHVKVAVTSLRFEQLHYDALPPRQNPRNLPLAASATRCGFHPPSFERHHRRQESDHDVAAMSDPMSCLESASSSLTFSSSPRFESYTVPPHSPNHSALGGPSPARRLVRLSLTGGRVSDTTSSSSYPSPSLDPPSSSSSTDRSLKYPGRRSGGDQPSDNSYQFFEPTPSPLMTAPELSERSWSSSCLPTPTPSRVHSIRARSTLRAPPTEPSQGQPGSSFP